MSDKARDLTKHLAELANQIITDPSQLDKFSKQWSNGFHSYSFGNMLLILFQKPDATLCAGYHDWLDKHKRYVKRGERGLSILAPMFLKKTEEMEDGEEVEKTITLFRVVTTFDVSQTDGEPIELGHSDKVKGGCQLTLEEITQLFNYSVDYSNGIENGSTDGKTINLSDRGNKTSLIATYFHELAHCELKHMDKTNIERGNRDNQELEAEAVSYIVCATLGIENERSKYYIGNWRGDKAKLGNAGCRIIKTAEKIVRSIDNREVSK